MMFPTARGPVLARAFAVFVLALAPFIGRAEHPPGKTNRLADSSSAYLQQHARNPVDWHPWGPEAIERARRENKPIFLSIGYSACYWCHVANWTLYEDPEVARVMNRWFVNVKVDREERPDLDRVYLRATRLMTGSAGWPNNLFLTPGLKPFYAGSYWPRDDDDAGRPGFLSVMRRVHEEWTTQERRAREQSEKVAVALRAESPATAGAPLAPAQWRRAARDALLRDADPGHGGFRMPSGAKFPQAPALELLLAEGAGDMQAHAHLARTLEAMALGGLHDHLGGGFHRYTLDEGWSIPHFEKMLVDNAQLLALYARAFRATGRPLYRDVARSTATFLLRDLADPGGGFHVSLDAASGRKEGASYLWSAEEIARVLGPEASRRFLAAYGLELVALAGEDALVGEERRVLRVRLPLAETLARTGFRDADTLLAGLARERAQLLQARSRRAQPARDRKILVGANGLAIEAFAVSASALHAPRYREIARAAGERIWRAAHDPGTGRLARLIVAGRAAGEGFLEDYALLARGYLALAEATGDARWRTRARALADAILQRFVRADGRLASTQDDVGLFVPADEHEDYVHPSGPSAALDVFLRLGEPRFRAAAERVLAGLAPRFAGRPER
ncbi:MAG: thioredoxin domain-containing protein, partial [Betaproteobacteria bacterium]|nr:thioredoxin domain-containing protein [Betaproteobacteria bacterium]